MAGEERTPPKRKSYGKPPSIARLDKMIAEAVVDAYEESEQMVGFYTMLPVPKSTLSGSLSFWNTTTTTRARRCSPSHSGRDTAATQGRFRKSWIVVPVSDRGK